MCICICMYICIYNKSLVGSTNGSNGYREIIGYYKVIVWAFS